MITTRMLHSKKIELNEVFLLRGVASLMVCLYHVVLGNEALFPSNNWLEKICSFGYLGVEVFFILSGYVICYSLPVNFGYRHLRTFFLKRIARIEPPYIVSILLVLVLNLISTKITGLPNHVDVIGVISHLAYINNFMPGTYVNVVYWTLGIEAQFYLLIAFLFPLMKASKRVLALLLTAFIAIACIPVAGSMSVILPFLSYFALGILLYFHKIKKAMPLPFFIAGCLLGLMQLYFYQDLPGTIAAALTICVILFWVHVNPLIKFLSTISYSLYLVHVPVGGKVINLGLRWVTSDLSKYALVILALSVSISAAFAFYKLVELPAFRLSKRFRYDPQQGEKSFEDKDSKKTEVFAATVS